MFNGMMTDCTPALSFIIPLCNYQSRGGGNGSIRVQTKHGKMHSATTQHIPGIHFLTTTVRSRLKTFMFTFAFCLTKQWVVSNLIIVIKCLSCILLKSHFHVYFMDLFKHTIYHMLTIN